MIQPTVLILGMHRSGTSWLTGSLQQTGLYLGKHHSWNPHNRKGNRENPDIMALHESILADNRGAWDAPPEFIVWSEKHKVVAKQLIVMNTVDQRWGFKDPRTLLVLEGWKLLLDEIAYVGIFRHPLAVASSLYNRGGMSLQKAFDLWEYYNRLLLNQYMLCPFPLLCFDWSEKKLHQGLLAAADHLKLKEFRNIENQTVFFDAELRHNQGSSDIELPESVAGLYQQLVMISQQWAD